MLYYILSLQLLFLLLFYYNYNYDYLFCWQPQHRILGMILTSTKLCEDCLVL